jgi:hypothetical protein
MGASQTRLKQTMRQNRFKSQSQNCNRKPFLKETKMYIVKEDKNISPAAAEAINAIAALRYHGIHAVERVGFVLSEVEEIAQIETGKPHDCGLYWESFAGGWQYESGAGNTTCKIDLSGRVYDAWTKNYCHRRYACTSDVNFARDISHEVRMCPRCSPAELALIGIINAPHSAEWYSAAEKLLEWARANVPIWKVWDIKSEMLSLKGN